MVSTLRGAGGRRLEAAVPGRKRRFSRALLVVAAHLQLLSTPVAELEAQSPTGALHGSVSTVEGEPLSGVVVEVSGIGAARATSTNERGEFHFLGLDPGDYALEAGLEGFSTVEYQTVHIRVARNTTIDLRLPLQVDEVINVTEESPLLDQRKIERGTHVTREELEAIPTARDPWAIVNQAPGVVIDRVDVGGSRGQQAVFTALGVGSEENDYQLDGAQITDMWAVGSSSTYYDFDQFQEVQLATGGSDITKVSAGVTLNLVTKRGQNEPRGSARFLLTDDGWQSSPRVDAGDFPVTQETLPTDELARLQDYGLELGGPARTDRLWLWGAWARNRVDEIATGGLPRQIDLETAAGKANAQISETNSAVGSWHWNEKSRLRTGAGPGVEDEATWDQRSTSRLLRFEDTHMVSRSLMLAGSYAGVDVDVDIVGRGGVGPAAAENLVDSDGVEKQNAATSFDRRSSKELRLSGSVFFYPGEVTHELQFGGRRRRFDFQSETNWPGRQLTHVAGNNVGFPDGPVDFVIAHRSGPQSVSTDYASLWLQDTLSWQRWTLNLGVRFDLQEGENRPSAAGANPAFPSVLPAITFPGNDGGGLSWKVWSPRLGATYALTRSRTTLLRASLARFTETLGARDAGRVNPVRSARAFFRFTDLNDNNVWDGAAEPTVFLFPQGFDPADPSAIADSPNRNDPALAPALTDEVIFAVEHAILPELVLDLHLTYRNTSDLADLRPLVRDGSGEARVVNRDDYIRDTVVEGDLPDGRRYQRVVYALSPELSFTGGELLTTGEREIEYRSAALSALKRFSNDWMLRGFVNYAKTDWRIPNRYFDFQDPTNLQPGQRADDDGQPAVEVGLGSDFLHSTWMFNVNGLYRVAARKPWSFDLSANVNGRQGYPLPYYHFHISPVDGNGREVQAVTSVDDFRTDDIITVDLGLSKHFSLRPDGPHLTLTADLFNALNEGYVFRRELRLNGPRRDFVNSTLSPRVWRFGMRLSWP